MSLAEHSPYNPSNMKVGILAGGFGTRLSEETSLRPKPMVEIGGQPILWHIMKYFASWGFREFVIALGYKGHYIKDYFINYRYLNQNLIVDLAHDQVQIQHNDHQEDWRIHLIDTGRDTNTGGRVRQIAEYIGDEPFVLTYGDGVADVNMAALLSAHESAGRLATVTAVRPPSRYGSMMLENGHVAAFQEKPVGGDGWINGGYFILEPMVAGYIDSADTAFEQEPIRTLVDECQLSSYRHTGFWHSMDTLRDVRSLETIWQSGNAPWKAW